MTRDTEPDRMTTTSVRESTRAELQRLKAGGQSYDEFIRAILGESEGRAPWFSEGVQKIADSRQGEIKLEPNATLWEKDRKARDPGPRRRIGRRGS